MSGKKPIPYIDIEDITPNDKSATKCAPHLEFSNGSCIPLELLIKMAESYNKYQKNKNDNNVIIGLDSRLDTLYPDDYKKYLLSEFKNRFDGDQKDWINSKYLELMDEESKDHLENKVFRPDGPQGQFDWLSTIDINQVLYQYEEKYPGFKFLGAVPMDFAELDYLPFKNLNFEDLENDGVKNFGVIFNTDKSYQRGKHWISLYCDFDKSQIYFSDSMGTRPPKEVNTFMKSLESYIQLKKNSNVDIRYNKTQHQRGNSECGVYSINFILRLLKGKDFDHITKKRLEDHQVNKCRIKYFGKMDNSKIQKNK
jgi:hypothetical protein